MEADEAALDHESEPENDDVFGLLFRCNPIPMLIISRENLRFLDVNNAALSVYGFSQEEFREMTFADIRPEEDVEAATAFFRSVPRTYSHRGVWRHKYKDGRVRSVEIQAHPVIWQGEKAEFVTVIDVTERIREQAELTAREQRYRRAHHHSPFPVMIFSETGEVLSISKTWTELTGYAHDDIPTHTDWVRLALHDAPPSANHTSKDFDLTSAQRDGELAIRCKDGSTRIWDVSTMGLGMQSSGKRAAITMAFDLTERKASDEALLQSELRFRKAIENAPFPMMLDGDDGSVIAINRAWTELSGYEHHEIPTLQDWLDRAYGEKAPLVAKLVDPRFELTEPKDFGDFVIRTKSGQHRIWRFAGTNLGPQSDGRRVVISAAHDVTEQRALEKALRESEERLLKAIEEAPYPVMIHAEGAEVIALSRSWLEGAGYTYEDVRDLPLWTDHTFGDQAERIRQGIQEVQSRSSTRHEGEYRIKTKSGEFKIWEIVTVAAGTTYDGRNMAISIAYDLTERNQTFESLKLQTEALSAAANGIVITDVNGTIEWVNPAFSHLTGFTAEEAAGLNPRELVRSGLHSEEFYREMWQTILEGRVWKGELSNRKKDGTIYHEEMTITPVKSRSGDITHFVGIKQDITERKEAHEKLKQWGEELEYNIRLRTAELASATQEAERANQAKSEFLSRMSHELRTPLNSILGFAQILQLHDFGDEVRNISEPILKAGRHLLDLIDEILDISRIEVGKLSLSTEAISSSGIVSDAIDLVMPIAHKSGIRIIENLHPEELHYSGDLRRSVQILVNLLSNAIKFNRREGDVVLSTRHEDGWVIFEVADTGYGIAPEDQLRLFTPFERFGDRYVEGTGLGLSLSQRLARFMGGDLYLASSSPSGSVFALKLPATTSSARQASGHVHKESPDDPFDFGGQILYIEDNQENINLLEQLFKYYPEIRLIPALQGRTGLDFARLHKPDMILLDSHLPDIDGLTVLEILRAESATRHIPVVVLTADASSGHRKEMTTAGAEDFLTKPVQIDQLMAVIERILKRRTR